MQVPQLPGSSTVAPSLAWHLKSRVDVDQHIRLSANGGHAIVGKPELAPTKPKGWNGLHRYVNEGFFVALSSRIFRTSKGCLALRQRVAPTNRHGIQIVGDFLWWGSSAGRAHDDNYFHFILSIV